ncbi:MAG: lysoplasmalogenase [Alistipes sp.]|nr:lysoplasmalogenase [Alistipes sp.]
MAVGQRAWSALLTISFAVAVALYFGSWGLGIHSVLLNDLAKTLPLSVLTLLTWLAGGRKLPIMPAAFLFSALGDLAGEHRNFILQVGMFAVAHLLFIAHFSRRMRFDGVAYAGVAAVGVVATTLGLIILPRIALPVEQYACSLYIILIGAMAISATAQQSRYRWWYVVAALLFLFSDSCIAWNRYVERVPHAGALIMTTYFAAQYIFASTYLAEHRHRPTKS